MHTYSRPALWGLAVGGQVGVERVLQMLKTELKTVLQLLGCEKGVRDVRRDHARRLQRPLRPDPHLTQSRL